MTETGATSLPGLSEIAGIGRDAARGGSKLLSGELAAGKALARARAGAGHDAGVLAAAVPTAMLFVRNPTGVSHAPEEFASAEDCAAGVDALEAALSSIVGSA